MVFLKYLLLVAGFGFAGTAAGVVGYDVWVAMQLQRILARKKIEPQPDGGVDRPTRTLPPAGAIWRVRLPLAGRLMIASCGLMLVALSIVIIPDGHAGLRVSQISGVRPGTLYAGAHLVLPLAEDIETFDIRDRVYVTRPTAGSHIAGEFLAVQAREGMSLGLGVSVRYRLDPQRLAYIDENVPEPVDQEVVAPVVTSTFRDFAAGYAVRDVFTVQREEFRRRAADAITKRLAADGIVVKEVMLRDVDLPAEYARGLDSLLLEEQQSDRMGVETDIKQKQVKIAELEAEANKARLIKQAEAAASVRVLQAKAESDSMQYTLPLKQKQIEQARLEAAARKEATIQNAQAAAESKVIDSKAELERRKLLADGEANRIRVTAAADSERMNLEAAALKSNPMLIQKIIAERLSEKLQIIMVPADGKNFFAGDVLRSALSSQPDPDAETIKSDVAIHKKN